MVLMWTWAETHPSAGRPQTPGWRVLGQSCEPGPLRAQPQPPRDPGHRPARAPLTSLTACVSSWMIFSCGVATTLCPLISMMRCPTRMPPFSAMPPRIRLQIWGAGSAAEIRAGPAAEGCARPPPQTLPSELELGAWAPSPPAPGRVWVAGLSGSDALSRRARAD